MTITESLALLPDSPDARALVELSDLSDAEHALGAALEVADNDPLWPVLTGYATTAYMRAFLPRYFLRSRSAIMLGGGSLPGSA